MAVQRKRTVRKRTLSGTKSKLADPNAKALLTQAAEAAGLKVEELVQLAVDSGALVAPTPPTDRATEVYSLRDLGDRMWKLSSTVIPSDRPEWFRDKLLEKQQVALITFLRHRGFSSQTIAQDFGVSPDHVTATFQKFADELGTQVVNVRLNTIVGQLQVASERAAEGAMQKEDWSTYWRIQKEMISMLQSLGIVDRAIHRSEVEVKHTHDHEHRVKFEEQAKMEVDRMVELELKKQRRAEEIKQIEHMELEPEAEVAEVPTDLKPKVRAVSMDEKFVDEEYLEDIEDE